MRENKVAEEVLETMECADTAKRWSRRQLRIHQTIPALLLLLVSPSCNSQQVVISTAVQLTEETSISDSCRYLTEMQWQKQQDDPPEIADELRYKCGDIATQKELQGSYFPNKNAVDFMSILLEPLVTNSGQCPDRVSGTAPELRKLLEDLYPAMVMNIATDNVEGGNITRFIQLTEGYIYPAKSGGWINYVSLVENQEMPTLKQYVTSIPTLMMNGTTRLPKPIGADTKVFVANFQSPAPPTQAGFFFFGTELLNPCMWSTDSDFLQAPYFPGNGSRAAPCEDCKAHQGFLRAFNSVTNSTNSRHSILQAWNDLSGVPPEKVTRVLCAGFSLGAALATLCGPWAHATFPNAYVEVVTGGSPRVFNPAAAAWYDENVPNVHRVVNNKDIVPSLPPSTVGTMQYKHVGSPIFLDRKGEALPGEYVAFYGERPEWYTGSIGDHVSGYILGIKQAAECSVKS